MGSAATTIDPDKLMNFMGKLVNDLGAMTSIGPMLLGEKLGLYQTLAESGPMTPAELAQATNTFERYVREWLCAQAASGFVDYDSASGKFSMNPEQRAALGDPSSAFYFLGAVDIAVALMRAQERMEQAFRTGQGVGWHEYDPCLFKGTERFFRPGYMRYLAGAWIPALEGSVASSNQAHA